MGKFEIGVIAFVLAIIIFQQWMIRSGRYEKTRLPLKKRFLWAIICIIIPAIAFLDEPNIRSAIVICFIFFFVLLFGSNYKKISEQSAGVDEGN